MTATVDELKRVFGDFAGATSNLPSFGEIYPKREAPVLRPTQDGLSLETMTWGFPGPQAAKGRPVTNVRNLSSPFWRNALSNPERRCIVPVTKFSEWSAEADPETGRKRKYWFGLNEGDDPAFAFAGLWRPGDAEGERFMAFLTCAPNETVGAIHPKAMPVMLRPDEAKLWVSVPRDEAVALARPFPDSEMRVIDE